MTGLKPRNLPSPWCWWLHSHRVRGKYHYPHYTESSQDTGKPGYVCTATTDTHADISEPSQALPSCWVPYTHSPCCCKGRLDTPPTERAAKHSPCPWFGHWSEAAQGNYPFPTPPGLSYLCPGPQDSPFPYVFLQGKCPVPGSGLQDLQISEHLVSFSDPDGLAASITILSKNRLLSSNICFLNIYVNF